MIGIDMEDVAQHVVLIIDQLLLGEVHEASGTKSHDGIFNPTTTASLVLRGPIPSVATPGGSTSVAPHNVLVTHFTQIEITDTGTTTTTTTPTRSGTLSATVGKVIAVFAAAAAHPAASSSSVRVRPAGTGGPPAGGTPGAATVI